MLGRRAHVDTWGSQVPPACPVLGHDALTARVGLSPGPAASAADAAGLTAGPRRLEEPHRKCMPRPSVP